MDLSFAVPEPDRETLARLSDHTVSILTADPLTTCSWGDPLYDLGRMIVVRYAGPGDSELTTKVIAGSEDALRRFHITTWLLAPCAIEQEMLRTELNASLAIRVRRAKWLSARRPEAEAEAKEAGASP